MNVMMGNDCVRGKYSRKALRKHGQGCVTSQLPQALNLGFLFILILKGGAVFT